MFIPQFTVRRLLLLVAICAAFFLMLTLAARGYAWAAALSAVGFGVLVTFTSYVCFFGTTWVAYPVLRRASITHSPESPFARHRLPPQVIPEDIE